MSIDRAATIAADSRCGKRQVVDGRRAEIIAIVGAEAIANIKAASRGGGQSRIWRETRAERW